MLRFYGPVNPMGSCHAGVLRPCQPNGAMVSVVSLPNHIFTGEA